MIIAVPELSEEQDHRSLTYLPAEKYSEIPFATERYFQLTFECP